MFTIIETPKDIILLLDGQKLASVEKADIEDFTACAILDHGMIDFQTTSTKRIRFAMPLGDQYDEALQKLITITDRMGI